MCSGVVPQQPPTIAHAVALDELAEDVGQRLGLLGEDRLAVRAPGCGRPALGMQWIGSGAVLAEEADRVAHVLRPGRAVEADARRPSAPRAWSARRRCRCRAASCRRWAAARRDVWIGTRAAGGLERLAGAEHGGLDLEDVLRGLDDDQVDAARRAGRGPARRRPRPARGSAIVAQRRVLGGGQEAGGADRAGDEAVLADRLAGDLGGLGVDLQRVRRPGPTRRA